MQGQNPPSALATTEAPTVVCVDANQRALETTVASLNILGFKVLGTASHGFEAVRLVTANAPDIVIGETTLAVAYDGIELAKYLLDTFNLSFVFLTVDVSDSTFRKALEVLPQGFLTKPCRDLELRNTLTLARQHNKRRPKGTRMQGRLEDVGGALQAMQLLSVLTPSGKLSFDDETAIYVHNGNVLALEHPSVASGTAQAEDVLEYIMRRGQGNFFLSTLDAPPQAKLNVAIKTLALKQIGNHQMSQPELTFEALNASLKDTIKDTINSDDMETIVIEAFKRTQS
ncbi:MAG: response regulator [Deinococcota bacterium]